MRGRSRKASALRNEADRQRRRADAAERLLAAVRVERDAAEQQACDARESMAELWTSLDDTRKELVEERAARVREAGEARSRGTRRTIGSRHTKRVATVDPDGREGS